MIPKLRSGLSPPPRRIAISWAGLEPAPSAAAVHAGSLAIERSSAKGKSPMSFALDLALTPRSETKKKGLIAPKFNCNN